VVFASELYQNVEMPLVADETESSCHGRDSSRHCKLVK
jgi:hypothetical protein